MMDEYLADMAIRFWRGEHAEVIGWLVRLGRKLENSREEQYTLTGTFEAIRCGLSTNTDPVNVATQIGMLLAGPYWPLVFPKLVPITDDLWREASKKDKEAANA